MIPPHQDVLRVLVVEDEPRYRAFLIETLEDMGCEPIGAGTAFEAQRFLAARAPDALVLDLNLPVTDGMTFLASFRRTHVEVPVVIITGYGDFDAARRAISLNVTEFLTKPCHLGQIERAMDRVRRRLARTEPEAIDGPPAASEPNAEHRLAAIERRAILDALRVHRGNRSAAAAALGISRRALYNKIMQYRAEGVEVP
ncbi:MAG: DNA-binding response regulator [Phycisphaerales bacterium]|nr:DNA-binding response regulator [Phycisphaerales bacterium]